MEEVRAELKKYTRESLIWQLIENHESIMLETDQWLSTAKAVLALHIDKEQTELDSVRQIAKLNAGSLSTRILIEMALCECPESGGIEAGELDTTRLLANVMRMHYLGGWSEAIWYGGKKAEVRITPLGDVHTHIDFDEKIATPYGQTLGAKHFRHSARDYKRNFQEGGIRESVEEALPPEFWEAWIEAYGFSIDELRKFMDNIDDEGLRRRTFAFTCMFDELGAMDKAGQLPAPIIRNILDALSLSPRESWTSTPTGYLAKDWSPWRFRRRLSLISRPIIRLSNDGNPRYLIAPGIVRDGAAKVIQYCLKGDYDAKDFPRGRMRSWIGAAENRRGHEFNEQVSNALRELDWNTKPNVKLTEILNVKLDHDYGDIDVLAWRGKRILAIECKDLELAMTVGDIARQVHEFRGEDGLNGKPDRLKRHLTRIAILKSRMDVVRRYTRSPDASEIEACLVFSDIVPMSFSELAEQRAVRISVFESLANL